MPDQIKRTVETTSSGVPIYSEPRSNSKTLGVIPKGVQLTATQLNTGYYYITYQSLTGWISKNKTKIISSEDDSSVTTVDTTTGATGGTTNSQELTEEERRELYEEYENYFDGYNYSNAEGVLVKNMNQIMGMPYQFMKTVDPKTEDGDFFGMKYTERIITKSPLLLMTPGKVDFMPNAKKTEAAGVISTLASQKFGTDSAELSDILQTSGRYYTFAFNYTEYFEFVNNMCHACAIFLGIDDCKVNIGSQTSKSLETLNWQKVMENDFGSYFSASECIAFYVDSVNQVTDTFTNSTTESQIASKINSFSDVGKEISFLLGTQAGVEFDLFSADEVENITKSVQDIADKYLKGNQLFKDLGTEFATVAAGGKLLFPEIWDDSTFTRSFDINIKLRTPDCDPLSWYLNICVPMCHLIGLVAPQQRTNMGYFTPFLVRAFYKGLFNVDMGIITDMTFTKGSEGSWSIDGLPTVVDVSLTIKDLYQAVLYISNKDKWFMNNTTLMDYMANLCGININKPDIMRTFEIYAMLKKNKILNLPNKAWSSLNQQFSNFAMKAYQNLGNWLP